MDCSWLDLKKYADIVALKEFPDSTLSEITKLSNVNTESVLLELKQFAAHYFSIAPKSDVSQFSKSSTLYNNYDEHIDESNDEYEAISNCETCWKCIEFAFKVLTQLSGHSGMYNNLYQVFKYTMLLPCTQETCGRVFSKLKVVKTKLRSLVLI